MAPILSCHPGSLNAFALKLKRESAPGPSPSAPVVNQTRFGISLASDTIATIKARAARKLAIPDEGADIVLKYLWCDVFYTLDDGAFPLSPVFLATGRARLYRA